MKKSLLLILPLIIILSACSNFNTVADEPLMPSREHIHTDADDNGECDGCFTTVVEIFEIFSINDLHGKFADADFHPGVDEMTTLFADKKAAGEKVLLLSAGDMWQGSSESNLTSGEIIIEWMNELGFAAMTMGNHEFDWGTDTVEENSGLADFPFVAINIYDRETNAPVEYCTPSAMVDTGRVQIGIIGAAGDNYSSISADKTQDIYFVVGDELTELVKAEAESLRANGADFIIYLLHDGMGGTVSGTVASSRLAGYYDTELSDGYVDLVFEGHTHQQYVFKDEFGVYHLQAGGNNTAISYASISVNFANGNTKVVSSRLIKAAEYKKYESDPIVEELLSIYADQIDVAYKIIGRNPQQLGRNEARQLVAQLYYEAGLSRWGDKYDIVLGGGYMSINKPGNIPEGELTYADLQGLFPYDNQLVLCSVKGKDLKERFFESTNDNYFIAYGALGEEVKKNIISDKTYYIVTDTYSSLYAPNKLTEVERFDETTFARDLLAAYFGKAEVVKIVDKSIGSGLNFAMALEKFFEDEYGEYFYNCIKGNYVVAIYSNGSEKTLSDALKCGDLTMKDVDAFGIRYITESKNLVDR